jgi:hypothetical protein
MTDGNSFVDYWRKLYNDAYFVRHGDEPVTVGSTSTMKQIATSGKYLIGLHIRGSFTSNTATLATVATAAAANPGCLGASILKGIKMRGNKSGESQLDTCYKLRNVHQIFTDNDPACNTLVATAYNEFEIVFPCSYLPDEQVTVQFVTANGPADVVIAGKVVSAVQLGITRILSDSPAPLFNMTGYGETLVTNGTKAIVLAEKNDLLGLALDSIGSDSLIGATQYINNIFISDEKGEPILDADYRSLTQYVDSYNFYTRKTGNLAYIFSHVVQLAGKSVVRINSATVSTPGVVLFYQPQGGGLPVANAQEYVSMDAGMVINAQPRTRFNLNAGAGFSVRRV